MVIINHRGNDKRKESNMKTIMQFLTVASFLFLVACGDATDQLNSKKTSTTTASSQLTDEPYVVTGYISPLNITVNNKEYTDTEDFYTQEVNRLITALSTQYPNYTMTFNAAVGLQDFIQNMSVFLVSSSNTGVAAQGAVTGTGKFTFNLSSNVDVTQLYTVRASKRIGLILTNGQNVLTWCYNLYAEDDQVSLNGSSIVLKDFKTMITSYQCEEDSTQDITVPNNPYNYVTAAFENGPNNGYGPVSTTNASVVIGSTTTTTPSTPSVTATSSGTISGTISDTAAANAKSAAVVDSLNSNQ